MWGGVLVPRRWVWGGDKHVAGVTPSQTGIQPSLSSVTHTSASLLHKGDFQPRSRRLSGLPLRLSPH